jgi:hypothetical protein
MRSKKAAAKPPEPGPKTFSIGCRQPKSLNFFSTKKGKPAFAMHRRQVDQPRPHLEQKHQPMALPLVAMLAHDSRQMKG